MSQRHHGRLGAHSLNRLIPNSLTILAMCAGVTAMRFAMEGFWDRAVIAIVVAGVLDGLDGRIARALGATSRFGAELDSLSYFVCFGVAPAVVVYLWAMQGTGGLGWALALLFAVCCALRLARFNVGLSQPSAQADSGSERFGSALAGGASVASSTPVPEPVSVRSAGGLEHPSRFKTKGRYSDRSLCSGMPYLDPSCCCWSRGAMT